MTRVWRVGMAGALLLVAACQESTAPPLDVAPQASAVAGQGTAGSKGVPADSTVKRPGAVDPTGGLVSW